ncbi:tRNA 2-thiouridine(34) synthase MnmA [Helicobacter suis]|uniref:tRNA-specific 2-thiouridylase MnmA n=2 Tax=Helicobacter suis TaxID=104628 RepID=E7G316_9HELI|nr:tRNA 2-thiouridine(34) synthase MnmA [Helicobacter suis]EFX42230.1 tRNA (5-methylaminomethyl-2-thiouridylate)-methyltransferase [Helicobacter suis HS5]EFX43154.1 tRNA (5-methylaminomethyl-2-thiouridylate)-methyltransferase [Helicobacter suis HS1]BCD48290.1 tRNA-specific 2-thiouridylase MnmA [Helicobacter suis]BCD50050.1 tRNA-specific 2-thiouridylase MnmA [Helicobacter suis]BCD51813.1 tRNA-specific 2-thiouridylase MnmA [Helicobacter suis]
MKIAVLMSGGVDSSYSAYLLKQAGHDLLGLYLKLHGKEEKHAFYIKNCQEVASFLNIPFEVVDLQEPFKKQVYEVFIDTYKNGQTPNPCALCNPLMKFGLGLEFALDRGCEKVATGHYARLMDLEGVLRIQEAFDLSKDQSYFLYALPQHAIDALMFPLGGLLKSEIKPKALEAMPFLGDLQTYKESQEICFVEGSYIDTLKQHIDVDQKGLVRNLKGEVVGTHKGYMHYTIGKRKGFTVQGAHTPHFVVGIHAKANEIIVGEKEDLAIFTLEAENKSLPSNFKTGTYMVKVRYRSTPTKAKISLNHQTIHATFEEPVYGVALGQALVIYEKDCVLGGGVITKSA